MKPEDACLVIAVARIIQQWRRCHSRKNFYLASGLATESRLHHGCGIWGMGRELLAWQGWQAEEGGGKSNKKHNNRNNRTEHINIQQQQQCD